MRAARPPIQVVCAALGVLLASSGAFAADSDPAAFLGEEAPPLGLPDAEGRVHDPADYRGNSGTVIIWLSTKCPVSNAYHGRIAALAGKYQPEGFTFLGVNSNRTEEPGEIAAHASQSGLDFPILRDARNVVADAWGASVTPEVYVLDTEGILRYHGRIDDSMDASGVSSRDLEAALAAMLAGETPPKDETRAFGCTIKRLF